MNTLTIILLALGLAMDCFAVAVAEGAASRQAHLRHGVAMAFFFGLFQGLMPVVGWLAGLGLRNYVQAYDHWIALGLLGAVGVKMIYEGVRLTPGERTGRIEDLGTVLILAVATSIDALAIGITVSILHVSIMRPALMIGAITFGVSLLGNHVGRRLGHFFEGKTEILAGLVLVGLGLKIVFEHVHRGI